MHSQKVISMTTVHFFQKPLTPRQITESHVREKSYCLIHKPYWLSVKILKTHSKTIYLKVIM